MRNTDPFVWFRENSDAIFRWLGIAGLALLLYLLLRVWAMRWGGWRAAWARLRREVAVTAHAFAQPLRAWLGHRRALRLLVRRLRDQATWRDAERALAAARTAVAPARPYAALVGTRTVTVLLAERGGPDPWTVDRADLPTVTPEASDVRPIVVATGTMDHAGEQHCAFLDLAAGPPVLSVTGDDRASRALLQALAAQLDVRLPHPLVVVAEGVHRDHPGEPVREAYRVARETPPRLGIAPVLVAAELPDPLPPELAAPPGDTPALRVLVRGPGRGYVRTLLTDRHGRVAAPGTPLLARCAPLSRAVARVLPIIPPVLPPAPSAAAAPGLGGADLFEEGEEAAQVFRTGPPRPAGPTATTPATGPLRPAEPGSTATRSVR